MKILFVISNKMSSNPITPLSNQSRIQFGISSIASLLEYHGHEVDLLAICQKTQNSFIEDYIATFAPQIVSFTSVFSEYDIIVETAKYIKSKFPNIYQIIGGVHVSLNPNDAIKDGFDAVCVNEGEYPLLELVETLENNKTPSKIKNIWFNNNGNIEKNPNRSFIEDLDELPLPNIQMWQKWIENPNDFHQILLGRGCPFECTYCCNHALKKLADSKYVRFRSPKIIVEELNRLTSLFPNLDHMQFRVETIGVNIKYALNLCQHLEQFNSKRIKPISFGVNLRIAPNINYDQLFSAMKKANFDNICIGLESGSEKVRYEILNRRYSNEQYYEAMDKAREYGLKTKIYVLIGIPGETHSDFKETIKCLRISQPDYLYDSIFFPYPGTRLFQICQEQNLLPKITNSKYERQHAFLDLPNFSKKQIEREYVWIYYNVYKGRKSLCDIYKLTKSSKLQSSKLLRIIDSLSKDKIIGNLHRFKHIFIKGGIFKNRK